jgi:hypothetical protein
VLSAFAFHLDLRYYTLGESIARWVPELAALPPGHLRHRPWCGAARYNVLKLALNAPDSSA